MGYFCSHTLSYLKVESYRDDLDNWSFFEFSSPLMLVIVMVKKTGVPRSRDILISGYIPGMEEKKTNKSSPEQCWKPSVAHICICTESYVWFDTILELRIRMIVTISDKSSNIWVNKPGWWYTYRSEKYEFVSWDDEIPNIWKVIIQSCSSHHQADLHISPTWNLRPMGIVRHLAHTITIKPVRSRHKFSTTGVTHIQSKPIPERKKNSGPHEGPTKSLDGSWRTPALCKLRYQVKKRHGFPTRCDVEYVDDMPSE